MLSECLIKKVMSIHGNVGWRKDYQIVSGNLKNHIKKQAVYRDDFFSDHAPLIFTYKI